KARRSVDFPEPEAPMIEIISPGAIVRLMSVRICRVEPLVPKARPTCWQATAGGNTVCVIGESLHRLLAVAPAGRWLLRLQRAKSLSRSGWLRAPAYAPQVPKWNSPPSPA